MSKKEKLASLSTIKKTLYANWALRVKEADGWKCALCGSTDNLTAHHWYCSDHFAHAARYCLGNGVTLCYACHIRSVHTRADWTTVSKIREYMEEQRRFNENYIVDMMAKELSTAFLRELWDTFRIPRTISRESDHTLKELKKGKWFLYLDERHPSFVVNNLVNNPNLPFDGKHLFEVKVVTKLETSDGEPHYRYSLQKVSETQEERG
jgi:uncharacterized protein (UPF0147 family)